jgi:uncharacterized membrane protein SpoIIM required for sporulation
MLTAGYLIGTRLAGVFTLPPELLQLERIGEGLTEQMARFGLLSGRGFVWVLWNNVRAMGIASLLGGFSFGVLGAVLLMTPIGLVGYFAANVAIVGGDAGTFLLALVAPHGVLEVPAALLAGAAIVDLGLAVISPPEGRSLSQAWLVALARWARVMVGIVTPILIAAAFIEVFVTPQIAARLLSGP